jgi:hypothetical protein
MRSFGVIVAGVLAAGCVVRTVTLAPLDNLAVRGFVAHAEREWPAAPSAAQTVDTLDWMAMAVESLAGTRRLAVENLPARLGQLRASIKEFSSTGAESLTRTRVLKRIFTDGAGLIGDLARAAGTRDVDYEALERVAGALDIDELPRNQPDVIERYFQEASNALQRVDRGGGVMS